MRIAHKRTKQLLGAILCVALVAELVVFAARRPIAPPDPLAGAHAYTGDAPSVNEWRGTTHLRFDAPPVATDALRIEFAQSLAGAKVNVTGHTSAFDSIPLVREQRINSKTLDILWQDGHYAWLEVEVLNHHRPPPALHAWSWFRRRSPSKIGD